MVDHAKAAGAAAREAARKAVIAYASEHPEARRVKLGGEVYAYIPRPKDVRIAKWAAYLLRDKRNISKSNAQLVAMLRKERPEVTIPENSLVQPLKAKEITEVREALDGSEFNVDLNEHRTISAVKKAIRARLAGEGAETYSIKVAFSGEAVTVGDRAFPIQRQGGVRRIHVGKSMLNVEVLKQLLTGPL